MVEVILLGIAQDAGVPQAGCGCDRCVQALTDSSMRAQAACLGFIDRDSNQYWLIDATPDFKDQLGFMMAAAPDRRFGGILLTHLHMGHYTGLIHLGEEAANLKDVPLYCTRSVWSFLKANAPWSRLISGGNLTWKEVVPGVEFFPAEKVQIQAYEVPHRCPDGETLAYGLHGQEKRLIYCPDIDSWEAWEIDLKSFLSVYEIALLDGTFFDHDEVPGRKLASIPHPTVLETMDILDEPDRDIVFIHLNHTNPLLSPGEARETAVRRGFRVGFEGQRWDLGPAWPELNYS